MKKYKTRVGVVLGNICNDHILIAAKEARDHCPYITELNDIGAYIYKHLEDGYTDEQIIEEIQKEYEFESDQNISDSIIGFIEELKTMGYIFEE